MLTLLHRCFPLIVVKLKTIFFNSIILWILSCIATSPSRTEWLHKISATISFTNSMPMLKGAQA